MEPLFTHFHLPPGTLHSRLKLSPSRKGPIPTSPSTWRPRSSTINGFWGGTAIRKKYVLQVNRVIFWYIRYGWIMNELSIGFTITLTFGNYSSVKRTWLGYFVLKLSLSDTADIEVIVLYVINNLLIHTSIPKWTFNMVWLPGIIAVSCSELWEDQKLHAELNFYGFISGKWRLIDFHYNVSSMCNTEAEFQLTE